MEELHWHPPIDDPAHEAGTDFSRRHPPMPAGFTWAIRQAFWAGVKWERDNQALPIAGIIDEDGKVRWKGDQP